MYILLCKKYIINIQTTVIRAVNRNIFHCDAKLLASGNFALPDEKDSTFALPNAKNTNMLVSLPLDDANFWHHLTQNPQRESVEYRLRWVPNANILRWPCTFQFLCVDFIRVR